MAVASTQRAPSVAWLRTITKRLDWPPIVKICIVTKSCRDVGESLLAAHLAPQVILLVKRVLMEVVVAAIP